MQVLKLKATLRGTDPLVWRTLYFLPETGLEQVSDMLMIATGWDEENSPFFISNGGPITPEEDAWFEADLKDYLAAPGDLFSYAKESEDEYLIELELISTTEIPDEAQLPSIITGANQAPPEDIGGLEVYARLLTALADRNHPEHQAAVDQLGTEWDATAFNPEALNEEAFDFFEGEFGGMEIDFNDFDDDYDFGNYLLDVDSGKDISFDFDWLAQAHGIKVTDKDVRETPKELVDFRASLTEDDLGSPLRYLKLLEPLFKKYPNDALLNLEMAGLYALTGERAKGLRISRSLDARFPDNLELLVNKLLSFESEEAFMNEVAQLPHPLDIRNHPAGKDGYYHTLEFLNFEEVAIREAVNREDLATACSRLDRLIRFGFLHGDVETPAMATAELTMRKMQEKFERRNLAPADGFAKFFAAISERTAAILEASIMEITTMLSGFEEEDFALPTARRAGPKVGRNAPCPCGSGKKYKKCCL